ncbi:MAG: hypothetical protein ACFFCZ_22175 [Promethearchaeota archaeon]
MTIILAIDGNDNNWYDLFADVETQDGSPIQIEQTLWKNVSIASYSDRGAYLRIQKSDQPIPGTSQEENRIIKPDLFVVRSLVRPGPALVDLRNILYGLKFGNVPCINSLHSLYCCLERPWVFSELLKIQKRLGADKFPIIEQIYYSHPREMIITPQFPIVVKMGCAHAGFGKMRLQNHNDFDDFRTVIALTQEYVTAEPFIETDYDIRIQKIGTHFRAYKRIAMGWKGNQTTTTIEQIPVTSTYKLWIEESSKIFGGLDICALDVIHATDGREYILELNDSAIGLAPQYVEEDMRHIKKLVMTKID